MRPNEQSYLRNGRFTASMPFIAGAHLLAGVLSLFYGELNQAIIWTLLAALWWINLRWSRKTPFMVLSDEALTLFSSPFLPRKVVPWEQMVRLRLSAGGRCQVFLHNGRRFYFRLFWVDAEVRQTLIERIQTEITRKGAGMPA